MNLSTFLAADRIVLGLTAATPREVLEKLVDPMVKADIVSDPERFLADLERREAEITTVMENGVVIPHARSNAVKRLGLCVGIASEPGIIFNPEAGVLSRLFFCIAVPAFAPTAHMPLLQRLAKFAREPQRVERLLKSKTASIGSRYLGSYKG